MIAAQQKGSLANSMNITRFSRFIPQRKTLLLLATGFVFGLSFPALTSYANEFFENVVFSKERGGYLLTIKSQSIGLLNKGDPVYYEGVVVGKVQNIQLLQDNSVGAECAIRKDVKIENTTIGRIQSGLYVMANQYVYLRRMPYSISDKVSPKYLNPGDTIQAEYEGGIYDWLLRDSVNFFQKIDYMYNKAKSNESARE